MDSYFLAQVTWVEGREKEKKMATQVDFFVAIDELAPSSIRNSAKLALAFALEG